MKRPILLLCGAALLASLACGGGGSSPATTPAGPSFPGDGGGAPATKLAYTAASPGGSTTWNLDLDPASTSGSSHLVLDLTAPTGTSGQGFTVVLTLDPSQATWSKVDGTHYAVQSLFSPPPAVGAVGVASVLGSDLRIVFGQAGAPVSYGTSAVFQVALDVASTATAGKVTLTASQGGNLGASAPPTPVTVSIGSLQAE